jgi:hypothetical protein
VLFYHRSILQTPGANAEHKSGKGIPDEDYIKVLAAISEINSLYLSHIDNNST